MALSQVPAPGLHSWTTWIDAVISVNPGAARMIDNLEGEERWREVADRLTELEPTTPRHDSFLDWREWAINLIAVNPR